MPYTLKWSNGNKFLLAATMLLLAAPLIFLIAVIVIIFAPH